MARAIHMPRFASIAPAGTGRLAMTCAHTQISPGKRLPEGTSCATTCSLRTMEMGEVPRTGIVLSSGHHQALLALSADWQFAPATVSRQAIAGLASKHGNLCERRYLPGHAQTQYRLTPQGIAAVAAILKDQGNG